MILKLQKEKKDIAGNHQKTKSLKSECKIESLNEMKICWNLNLYFPKKREKRRRKKKRKAIERNGRTRKDAGLNKTAQIELNKKKTYQLARL